MKRILLFIVLIIGVLFEAVSQNVAINADGAAPNSSAMLDVQSDSLGFLVPRLTTAQRLAITSPANALIVYQTDNNTGFYFNSGTPGAPIWVRVADTTDASGIDLASVLTNGNDGADQTILNVNGIGIGTTSNNYELHINEASGVNSFMQMTVASLGTVANDGLRIGIDNGVVRIINEERNNLTLETDGLQRMIVDSIGNIGMGGAAVTNNLLTVSGRGMFDTLGVNSGFTFPSVDGTADQILRTDGRGGVSWGDLGVDTMSFIQDAYGDTRILVDSNATDDDVIHFEMNGTEYFRMRPNRLEVLNSGFIVFIGDSAGLNDDLSNNYNVGIGNSALYSNTSGSYNMALGYFAMQNNTTGVFNSSVGVAALLNNTTGNYNSSTGYLSNGLNTTGDLNVAIGYGANYNNQTGDQNVAIGALAGLGNTGASKTSNLYLGVFSGYRHTRDSSIFIGNRAGFNETRSNVFYLDNTATTDPLLFGDLSNNTLTVNDTLAIGTYSPNEKLDVEGSAEIDGHYNYETAKTHYYSIPALGFNNYKDAGVSNNHASNTSDPDGASNYEDYGGNNVVAYYAAPVYLPDSVTITEVSLYLYDNDNAREIGGELRRHTLGTDATSLVDLTNLGTSGVAFTSGLTTLTDNTISNALVYNELYSYNIRVVSEESTAQLRIYGARITYTKNRAD